MGVTCEELITMSRYPPWDNSLRRPPQALTNQQSDASSSIQSGIPRSSAPSTKWPSFPKNDWAACHTRN
jgi:hypothetical protein